MRQVLFHLFVSFSVMQRVARLIARNPRSLQLRAASHATSETPSTSSIATTKMESLLTGDIPVEKRSLTRGLAMNKFEKVGWRFAKCFVFLASAILILFS